MVLVCLCVDSGLKHEDRVTQTPLVTRLHVLVIKYMKHGITFGLLGTRKIVPYWPSLAGIMFRALRLAQALQIEAKECLQ